MYPISLNLNPNPSTSACNKHTQILHPPPSLSYFFDFFIGLSIVMATTTAQPSPTKLSGGCLCGTIRYEVTADAGPVYSVICHCLNCKKATGTHMINTSIFRKEVGLILLTQYAFHLLPHPLPVLFLSYVCIHIYTKTTLKQARKQANKHKIQYITTFLFIERISPHVA